MHDPASGGLGHRPGERRTGGLLARGGFIKGRHGGSGARPRTHNEDGLPGSIATGAAIGSPDQPGRPEMRRRQFIAGLGSAAAWPVVARAQQGDRVRRIGVLLPYDEIDPFVKRLLSAFTQALTDLGWTDGRNVRMDLRWTGGDIVPTSGGNRSQLARELVGLHPDIIVTGGTPATVAVQRETRTIPIVFAMGPDPVASGIVARLDRPGGNWWILIGFSGGF